MNFFNFLADEASGTGANNSWIMWVILGVIVVLFVVWMVYSSKKQKKQQQEVQDKINAVKPGNKVKTIGGVCGIVVEVDLEENTFILETGSETTGKCYVKFDKQAIFDTDAVAEVPQPAEEKPAEPEKADGAEPAQPAEEEGEKTE